MQASLQEVADFFRTAHWPKETERRLTFFSIAGFPHYENVMSNVYQFFFETENPHGLGSLCVDALLDIAKEKNLKLPWSENAFSNTHAIRELRVDGGQRLDLLLHNSLEKDNWHEANAAILIENKVYHWLANDLSNYWNSVSSTELGGNKIGIVLGLYAQALPAPWIYVTHSEWAIAVERRLGFALYRAETRYTTLLLELIENIRTMTNANEDFENLFVFFQEHRAEISRAEKIRDKVMQEFPGVLKAALSPTYEVSSVASANREGWLWIARPGNHPLRYVLGYYEVFHNDEKICNYQIAQIVWNHEHADAEEWRDKLSVKNEAQTQHLSMYDRHYVLGKIYQLIPTDYHRLPQLIAENLKNDWQPLEKYWLTEVAK